MQWKKKLYLEQKKSKSMKYFPYDRGQTEILLLLLYYIYFAVEVGERLSQGHEGNNAKELALTGKY